MKYETERLELGALPRTVEELRDLQTQMLPLPERPRPPRAEPRRPVDLPMEVAWETSDGRQHAAVAQARNVTSTSVYFELDRGARCCSPELLLELEPGRELSFCGVARIVRVVPNGEKIGIAVEIEDFRYQVLPNGRAKHAASSGVQ